MSAEKRGAVVAHLSDCHVDEGDAQARALRRTVDAVLTLGDVVDFVVVTGDIAQHGRELEYRAARRELDRLRVPVVVCPGNHDMREAFAEVMLDESGADSRPLHRVYTHADVRVLALDSTVPGNDHGTLDDAVIDWAITALADDETDRPVLVALHHTPLQWHPDQLQSLDKAGTDVLRRLLRAVPAARMVLGGHFHHAMSGTLAGVPTLAAPSVAPRIPPPWEPTGHELLDAEPGFAVHAIAPSGSSTSFFRRVS